jgi:hypothetical protein
MWIRNIKIYKTVILPAVLYGCDIWSVTLREGQRLRLFENRVLRTIFGPKREEVAGSWRRLHNVEFHNLHASPNVIRVIKWRRMKWAGYVARTEETRSAYKILVGTSEERRPLGRPRRTWEDNIRIDLKEIGWGDMDWIQLAQDRDQWRALGNTVMNPRFP